MSINLTLHKLWLQNFMSYGKKRTEVQLDRGGMTLIKGVNLDDTVNGIGANGVGKSTLINAIVYAFYGESIGDSKVDDLINDINKNKCVVGIEFSIGNDRYVIERFRKMKAGPEGTYTNIYKNDDVDKDPNDPSRVNLAKATLPETNKFTQELIGMPKDLFIRLVVFDADEVSFFKLGAASQREVMENLFQITVLSEKAEFFREEQKEVKKAIEIQENNIQFLEKKAEEHLEQVANAKRRVVNWERKKVDELKELEDDLQQASSIDVDEQRNIFKHNDEIEKQHEELEKDKSKLSLQISELTSSFNDIKHQISHIENDISAKEKTQERNNKKIDRIEADLEHLDVNKCPECLQSMPDAAEKIAARKVEYKQLFDANNTIIEEIDSLNEQIKPLAEKADSIAVQIKDLKQQRADLTQQMDELLSNIKVPAVKNLEQLEKIQGKIASIKQQIEALSNSENPHIEAYEELENKSVDEIDYTELNDLKKLLDHQKFMLKLLTDKKSFLRQRLINKRLPYLNERLTHYLTMLGLPYQVEFQSDLTANIKRRGKTKSFSNLSHGQKARVNFALSFAFRDVMERVSRKVNVCLLDEVLDKALCDVGANAAITMIHEKCKQDKLSIFVITHKKEIANRFHNIMTVTMEKGFSRIE